MSDKLHDPGVAYAYAGFDHDFTFFKLYTKPIVRNGGTGVFEAKYRGVFSEFEAARDRITWIRKCVQEVLGKAMRDTHTELTDWIVEFSPIFEAHNIPSHLFLDRARDCKFLADGSL